MLSTANQATGRTTRGVAAEASPLDRAKAILPAQRPRVYGPCGPSSQQRRISVASRKDRETAAKKLKLLDANCFTRPIKSSPPARARAHTLHRIAPAHHRVTYVVFDLLRLVDDPKATRRSRSKTTYVTR